MEYSKVPIMIVGTGPEARVALDIANDLEVLVYGFLTDDDENLNTELNDILVVSTLSSKDGNTLLNEENMKLLVAVKEIDQRKALVEYVKDYKPELINMTHPSSNVSNYAKLGQGNLIQHATVIQANVEIGNYNLIEHHVGIYPDVQIEDFCTIQSGVQLGTGVQVEEEVYIGMGAMIYPGITLGKGCIIGSGAVVVKSVDEGATVFGNPARAAE